MCYKKLLSIGRGDKISETIKSVSKIEIKTVCRSVSYHSRVQYSTVLKDQQCYWSNLCPGMNDWCWDGIKDKGTYGLSIYLSRFCCTLDELPLFGLTNCVRTNTWKTKKITSLYRQDIELSDINLTCVYQISNPASHQWVGVKFDMARIAKKQMSSSSLSLNLLNKSTLNLQAPGGILAFLRLVEV